MRKTLAIVAIYLLLASFPFISNAQKRKSGVVPAWKIQLVDEAGHPVRGALVRQFWQDYDTEEDGHMAEARSDEQGFVSFPARKVRRGNAVSRAMGRLRNTVELGAHAGFGIHVEIMAWSSDLEGMVEYDANKPLTTQLVMHPRNLHQTH